jgi:hypothetical protein
VTGVQAGKKASAAGRADVIGIKVGQFHPIGSQLIEIGSFDQFLPEWPYAVIAHIVSKNEDDIWLFLSEGRVAQQYC